MNVTIPYKTAIISFLDEADAIAENIGAVNCILLNNGKTKGYNTDVIGFEQSLKPFMEVHSRAIILGTGGSAKAIAYVLTQLSIPFLFVSRKEKGNIISYQSLTEKIIQQHTLIINTTPLGMFPNINICPDIPYHFLSEKHLLYDLIYNPSETKFLQLGKQYNASIKNGEEMLMLQAEASWKIWNYSLRIL